MASTEGFRQNEDDIPMEPGGGTCEPDEEPKMRTRHILELLSNEGSEQINQLLVLQVSEQLRNWGIDFESPTIRGRTKVRKSNCTKGSRSDVGSSRLVPVKLRCWDITVLVPVLIKETCDFLRKHIKTEGIFRKSGSTSRVHALMQRFGNLETQEEFVFSPYDSVFDVATVLKQYLREMELPLIPYDIHSLFRKCLDVPSESSREEALLLSTCLLPVFNISVLTYLVEFLVEVVKSSNDNRMNYENLSIVMGPNIMPVDSKKSDKTKELECEMRFMEAHTKIIETLIKSGEKVGSLPLDMDKKIEANFSLRGSEDELENEGAGRRKKRRSGSLTRVLGFLKKVASTKTGDTPAPQTPGDFSDFTHTPIIKSCGKRRCLDENIFSLHKKKTILDGIRKNGIVVKDDDRRFAHITDTPNSIAGFITCPSPVCLNPSPMKMDWKQTPNAARFKNLVTPSLLRKKDKTGDIGKSNVAAPFSAPAKPAKSKLGLGKKSLKKQPPFPVPLLADKFVGLRRDVKRVSSSMSIHKLANSPRKVARASSTRIPRPDKTNPVRKSSSSCRFPGISPRQLKIDLPLFEKSTANISGEYVTLSPSAQIHDEKNEAFIASKISCLDDTLDQDFNIYDHRQRSTNPESTLRLTPLIHEINTLTLTAQEELTLSGLRKRNSWSSTKVVTDLNEDLSMVKPPPLPSKGTRRRSSGASNKARLDSPPNNERRDRQVNKHSSKVEDEHCKSIRQVEDKFIRAIRETKIMRIQSENCAMKAQKRAVNIHRRFSVQDRGFSPSQRRIMSVVRRRSHELNRPVSSPNRTPLSTDTLPRFTDMRTNDSLSRSPNRCTLKRGRPNTLRSGLARPSPASVRNTPATSSRVNDSSKENSRRAEVIHIDEYVATPMRRISSVQELVKLMEKGQDLMDNSLKPINQTQTDPRHTLSRCTSASGAVFVKPALKGSIIFPLLNNSSTPQTKRVVQKRECRTLEEKHADWVAGSDFNFETHKTRFLIDHNGDRDSIQALKSMNAGKVSENVKLFDGMSRSRKSPGKSLIPRYVALHRQESFKKK